MTEIIDATTDVHRSTPALRSVPQAAKLKLSVVIPTLNEASNIGWVLDRLPSDTYEVIVVDGQSVDHTIAVVHRHWPSAKVILEQARGKGAALSAGLLRVTGDIAVIIDADGSMDPAEIPSLVGALLAGADVVKGSRATAGGGSHDLSNLRRLGNWALTRSANAIYGQRWRELCYGYAAFWSDVLPLLGVAELAGSPEASDLTNISIVEDTTPLSSSTNTRHRMFYGQGFEIEAILFCRAARAGLRVAEVFSFEHRRRSGDSNLETWRDGWRVMTAVLHERAYRTVGPPLRNMRIYPLVPALHSATAASKIVS